MSYDSSLLAHAPQVSRAEHQEGYNVDILNHREAPPIPIPSTVPTPTRTPQPVRRAPSPVEEPRKPRPRFWQTAGGRIALAALALVVIGAIVGGAVGGTVGRHNKNAATQGSSSDSASGAGASITSIGLQPTQGAAPPAETTPVSIGTGGGGEIAFGDSV